MTKWITTVVQPTTVNSVFKAKNDIKEIAQKDGYDVLSIFRYDSANDQDNALHARIDGITAPVDAGDLVVFQYPTNNGNRFDTQFIEHLLTRRAKVVIFIHDAEILRGTINFDEIKALNSTSLIITHNPAMSQGLVDRGLTTPTLSNYAFDYLTDAWNGQPRADFTKELVFAGTLDKSRYLTEWTHATKLTVFGRHEFIDIDPRIEDRGEMKPEKLAYNLPFRFGLAWDSNIPGGGQYKNYTRFNNPHKISMYLANGLPVVAWKEAGMAPFIEKNHVGITLNSLDELDDAMAALTDQDIDTMLANVDKVRTALRKGHFTRRVLHQMELQVLDQDIVFD
jgi:hypothetical protein